MFFVIIIFSLIYLSTLYYILQNKDTKLALFYIKIMIVVSAIKLIHMSYYKIKGLTLCEMSKKMMCN